MMKLTKAFYVDAEPDEVMSAMLDVSVNPRGMKTETVYESPEIEGNVYRWSFRLAGVPQRGLHVVTEYIPGERMSFRNFGAMESTGSMTFAAANGGTEVTVDTEARLTMPLIGRFLDSALERGMTKNIEWTMHQAELRHAARAA